MPSSSRSSQPRDQPRSPTLQADSLCFELVAIYCCLLSLSSSWDRQDLAVRNKEDATARRNQRIPEFKKLERPLGVPILVWWIRKSKDGKGLWSRGNRRASGLKQNLQAMPSCWLWVLIIKQNSCKFLVAWLASGSPTGGAGLTLPWWDAGPWGGSCLATRVTEAAVPSFTYTKILTPRPLQASRQPSAPLPWELCPKSGAELRAWGPLPLDSVWELGEKGTSWGDFELVQATRMQKAGGALSFFHPVAALLSQPCAMLASCLEEQSPEVREWGLLSKPPPDRHLRPASQALSGSPRNPSVARRLRPKEASSPQLWSQRVPPLLSHDPSSAWDTLRTGNSLLDQALYHTVAEF